jgi:hypothetical protein
MEETPMSELTNTTAHPTSLTPAEREELDENERLWFECAAGRMLESEQKWGAAGIPFYWTSPSPAYVTPTNWDVFQYHSDCHLFDDPKAPCRRFYASA